MLTTLGIVLSLRTESSLSLSFLSSFPIFLFSFFLSFPSSIQTRNIFFNQTKSWVNDKYKKDKSGAIDEGGKDSDGVEGTEHREEERAQKNFRKYLKDLRSVI